MTPTVRFRVDFGGGCSIGIGKIELLEGIAATGSLAETARQMHMSYRRAWLLLEDMNTSFDEPVSRSSVGGRGGGGVKLTAFGSCLVLAYRNVESGLQPLADEHLQNLSAHAKTGGVRHRVRRALGRGRRVSDTAL